MSSIEIEQAYARLGEAIAELDRLESDGVSEGMLSSYAVFYALTRVDDDGDISSAFGALYPPNVSLEAAIGVSHKGLWFLMVDED